MKGNINAILISAIDDVATAIDELPKGSVAKYIKNDRIIEIEIADSIPKFHKFAVRDIQKSEIVRKYGEVIGLAITEIHKGSHVHEHNIRSPI